MIFFREGGNPERYSWKGRVPGGGGDSQINMTVTNIGMAPAILPP